jgi:hypothetical protein
MELLTSHHRVSGASFSEDRLSYSQASPQYVAVADCSSGHQFHTVGNLRRSIVRQSVARVDGLRTLFRQDIRPRNVGASEQVQAEWQNVRKFDRYGFLDGPVRRANLPWGFDGRTTMGGGLGA